MSAILLPIHSLMPIRLRHASLHIMSPSRKFAAVQADRGQPHLPSFDTLLLPILLGNLDRLVLLNIYAEIPTVVIKSEMPVADFCQQKSYKFNALRVSILKT